MPSKVELISVPGSGWRSARVSFWPESTSRIHVIPMRPSRPGGEVERLETADE